MRKFFEYPLFVVCRVYASSKNNKRGYEPLTLCFTIAMSIVLLCLGIASLFAKTFLSMGYYYSIAIPLTLVVKSYMTEKRYKAILAKYDDGSAKLVFKCRIYLALAIFILFLLNLLAIILA